MNGADESGTRRPQPSPQQLVELALARIKSNEQIARRTDAIHIGYEDGRLVVTGRLPSHYLKSVLQTAIGELPDGCRVDNRVNVVCNWG